MYVRTSGRMQVTLIYPVFGFHSIILQICCCRHAAVVIDSHPSRPLSRGLGDHYPPRSRVRVRTLMKGLTPVCASRYLGQGFSVWHSISHRGRSLWPYQVDHEFHDCPNSVRLDATRQPHSLSSHRARSFPTRASIQISLYTRWGIRKTTITPAT